MDSTSPGDITRLLGAIRSGNREAETELVRLIHPELRRLAVAYLRRENPDHTLQAPELVNELYLRLAGHTDQIENNAHFRTIAAQGMSHMLVDHARVSRARKRDGEVHKFKLDGLEIVCAGMDEEILALEEALTRLSEWDLRQARVVELRFVAGITEEEIGEVLGMSVRTVNATGSRRALAIHRDRQMMQ
jgi:RNA polymerase sigma factor (TIGR02999 family)